MENYVYILKSKKDHHRYIGSTNNLERRLAQHNKGEVVSTKNRRPLILFAYQRCNTLVEARIEEKQYKRSWGKYNRAIKSGILKIVGT